MIVARSLFSGRALIYKEGEESKECVFLDVAHVSLRILLFQLWFFFLYFHYHIVVFLFQYTFLPTGSFPRFPPRLLRLLCLTLIFSFFLLFSFSLVSSVYPLNHPLTLLTSTSSPPPLDRSLIVPDIHVRSRREKECVRVDRTIK